MPVKLRPLSLNDAKVLPRPGQVGVAREWVVWPEPLASREISDTFDVRISTLELAAPGPLSSLNGYDRLLTVIDGEGLSLSHGDAAPRSVVRRFDVVSFAAEWDTQVELSRGVVTVLNVTTRRGKATARIESLRLGERQVLESLEADAAWVSCTAGDLTVRVTDQEEPYDLHSDDSLWMYDLEGFEELELTGNSPVAQAVLVALRFA